MPRRRMIDPEIWPDEWFGYLDYQKQILFIGIVTNADDEGRIIGTPAYLRTRIFPYKETTDKEIEVILQEFAETNPNFILYKVKNVSYIWLKQWRRYQKPQYPKPSRLPAPPNSLNDSMNTSMNESMNHSIAGQSSLGGEGLGQSSLGYIRLGQFGFAEFLDDENKLTDRLTTELTKYVSGGRARQGAMEVVKKLWSDANLDMETLPFQSIYLSFKAYPLDVVIKALSKTVKHVNGKKNPGNYYNAVLKEKAGMNN